MWGNRARIVTDRPQSIPENISSVNAVNRPWSGGTPRDRRWGDGDRFSVLNPAAADRRRRRPAPCPPPACLSADTATGGSRVTPASFDPIVPDAAALHRPRSLVTGHRAEMAVGSDPCRRPARARPSSSYSRPRVKSIRPYHPPTAPGHGYPDRSSTGRSGAVVRLAPARSDGHGCDRDRHGPRLQGLSRTVRPGRRRFRCRDRCPGHGGQNGDAPGGEDARGGRRCPGSSPGGTRRPSGDLLGFDPAVTPSLDGVVATGRLSEAGPPARPCRQERQPADRGRPAGPARRRRDGRPIHRGRPSPGRTPPHVLLPGRGRDHTSGGSILPGR